jgi:peptidoglycan-N-acetylglucosamine deacetylase
MSTTFAVHVDCDPLWIYEREYGITLANHDAIYVQALPDLLALFRALGIRATFFVIGRELDNARCREFCRRVLAEGHTLANHSFTHATNFAQLDGPAQAAEIRQTHTRLIEIGANPKGYRSPGYFFSPAIGATLNELGYRYDGSILPGPASLLMAVYMRTVGKARDKSFGVNRNLFASRAIGNLGGRLRSVPIAVMPFLRMPVHTTFAYQFGQRYLEAGMAMLRRSSGHHVLLFHAIDLLDQDDTKSPVIPLRRSRDVRFSIVKGMLEPIAEDIVLTERILE